MLRLLLLLKSARIVTVAPCKICRPGSQWQSRVQVLTKKKTSTARSAGSVGRESQRSGVYLPRRQPDPQRAFTHTCSVNLKAYANF